jgi:site-specific recombinase XerD
MRLEFPRQTFSKFKKISNFLKNCPMGGQRELERTIKLGSQCRELMRRYIISYRQMS